MKKLLICVAVAGLVLLVSACGTTEPDYQPEPDITYPAAEEPEAPPPATTPTPSPTPPPAAPPVPGILAGAEEDLYFSQIPIPPQPLELSITRRTISAGRDMSAVILDDGSAWAWGGFWEPSRFNFAEYILRRHEAGTVSIYFVGSGGYTEEFIPTGEIVTSVEVVGLRRYQGRPNYFYPLNQLYIFDQDRNEISFADFTITYAEQNAFLLSPSHVADNIASVTAHARSSRGHLSTINEDGVLSVPGQMVQDENELWYRTDSKLLENVVDISTASHIWWRWGVRDSLHEGILFSDGSSAFIDGAGNMDEHSDSHVIAIAHGYSHMLFLAYDGTLWGKGHGDAIGFVPPYGEWWPYGLILDNVEYVSSGNYHGMALTKDGRLYAWGSNISTQIGDGSRQARPTPVFIMDNIVAISAGNAHSMAIDADGVLWGWGRNTDGQVGNRSLPQHATPVQVMEDVVAVSAGYAHTIALTSDGTLWAWGANANGQLGDGTQNDSPVPIQIKTGVMIP